MKTPVRGDVGRRDWYGPDPREPRLVERRLLAASGASALATRALGDKLRRRPPEFPPTLPYRKVFVVGCGRSGTTWVQECLTSTDAVVTTQESHVYENIFDPLRKRGNTPHTWRRIMHHYLMDRRRQRWSGLYWWVTRSELLDIAGAALATRDGSDEQVAQRSVRAVLDTWYANHAQPGQILLEKSPGHLTYARQILDEFPDALIVEVVRDGRDVCVSLEKHAKTMRWPPTTRSAQIRMWKRYVDLGEQLHADPALASRVIRVHYEDMRADPAGELARLFERFEVPMTRAELVHIAEVNDMARVARTSEGGHRRKGIVGDWRNELSADDIAMFEHLAGDTARRAGYDDAGRLPETRG